MLFQRAILIYILRVITRMLSLILLASLIFIIKLSCNFYVFFRSIVFLSFLILILYLFQRTYLVLLI